MYNCNYVLYTSHPLLGCHWPAIHIRDCKNLRVSISNAKIGRKSNDMHPLRFKTVNFYGIKAIHVYCGIALMLFVYYYYNYKQGQRNCYYRQTGAFRGVCVCACALS